MSLVATLCFRVLYDVYLGVGFVHDETLPNPKLGDDLSMLIATSTVLHRVLTFDKSLTVTVYSGLILTTLMAGFITWHCIVDETLMHPILFGKLGFYFITYL